ncbi:amino acid racemase [Pantoea dispersa]|uniref:aspartate/glutamate racemase family protein n=1 Tax=Pantoea dispersa TaxID=59814 RepID=UPI0024B75C0A|nr:amino acid racemase [Pantoea dispersa]MDI9766897.1 amino acid racemase [Pantoea dispersa]
MKKIGLIGGIGPESTLLYYKKLTSRANKIRGGEFFPAFSIESLNVFQVLDFCRSNDYAGLTAYMMTGINNLIAGGAELIALTGNTPHIVFDELQKRSTVPMISIVETASAWAGKEGIQKAGLLGTTFTMREDFFKKPFRNRGIQIISPSHHEIELIGEKISSELEHGIVRPKTQQVFSRIIERMVEEDGIDCIILGCTELPVLMKDISLPVKILDTLEVHVDELLAQSEV